MVEKLLSDFSEELQKTISIVKEIGVKVLELYDTDFDVEYKDDNSPVTQADLVSDRMIFENLVESEDGFISEETKLEELPLSNKRIWITDPLDGTKDFVKKTGDFSIMVAMLENNIPKIGVVYAPARKELFFAEKGKGAFVEREGVISEMKVNSKENIEDLRMVISRTHFSDEEQAICDELGVTNLRKVGSVGVKLSTIAVGDADFYLNASSCLGQWDGCAPTLILKEAGGFVFDKKGNEIEFNGKTWNLEEGLIGLASDKFKDEILRVIND